VKSGYPELANVIAKKRIGMAKAAGASAMVTSCPWCFENLAENTSDDVQVIDLIELIYQRRHPSQG
jgi:Fe-S oxidoreductase